MGIFHERLFGHTTPLADPESNEMVGTPSTDEDGDGTKHMCEWRSV